MPIRFQCHQCGARLKAPDNGAGRATKCLQCGTRLIVPEPVYEAEVVSEAPYVLEVRDDAPYVLSPEETFDLQEDSAYHLTAAPPAPAEQRRPCPACGEMIVATAVKCRFCGEVFDKTIKKARKVDRETVRNFRRNIHGLGGVWIFFGVLAGLIGLFVPFDRVPNGDGVRVVLLLMAAVWLASGIFSCLKHLWAVYVGTIFTGFSILGNLLTLNILGILVPSLILMQGIRTINLAGKMRRAQIPLDARP